MTESTHHDRTVTIDAQVPLGATEVVVESIPTDVYADWHQERLHEALSDTSSIPTHPGVLDGDVDDVAVIEVTKHDQSRAYHPK